MLKLFKYEGYKVTVAPEALLLKPIRAIWDRDKSKDKNQALCELGFIYFYCDPRSDYMYYVDDKERLKAIKEGEGLDKKWTIDSTLKEAITFYSSFKTQSALLLEDTRVAVDKLRTSIKKLDLSEVDDRGKPIYTLNTYTSTIKQIPELIKSLNEAEKSLNVEIAQDSKMRGQKTKSLLDDDLKI